MPRNSRGAPGDGEVGDDESEPVEEEPAFLLLSLRIAFSKLQPAHEADGRTLLGVRLQKPESAALGAARKVALKIDQEGRVEEHARLFLPLRAATDCPAAAFQPAQTAFGKNRCGFVTNQRGQRANKLFIAGGKIIPACTPHYAGKRLFLGSFGTPEFFVGVQLQADRFDCHTQIMHECENEVKEEDGGQGIIQSQK